MKLNPTEIKKILLIKPRGIGDIVLSTIVLENLYNIFPDAEIHYLVEEFARQSVENNPLVSKVITMRKNEFVFSIIKRVRKEKYELVIDMWSNPRTAQITFFSGAKYRVGYSYRGRKYAYNYKTKAGRGEGHSAEHNLELLKAIEVPIISKNISYFIQDENKDRADSILNELNLTEKNLVGIVPSGGWKSKRCEAEKWIDIIKELIRKFDVSILLLWGPGDEHDIDIIKTKMRGNVTIAPETDLNTLSALIGNCDLVIANDSGPMHIAAALNVPTIGLFGPTDPEKHGPYSENSTFVIKDDLHCIICNKLECPYNHECMKELDVNEVMRKVDELNGEFLSLR